MTENTKPVYDVGHDPDIEIKRGCMTNCRATAEYIHWNQYSIKIWNIRRSEISEIIRVLQLTPDQLLNAIVGEGIAALYGIALGQKDSRRQKA